MATEWFIKSPGEDLMPSRDHEGIYITVDCPDWITVPDMPGYPGGKRRCLRVFMGVCPAHPHHSVRHYKLEGDVQVAECSSGFIWYVNKT
jgi:hypothetical protein